MRPLLERVEAGLEPGGREEAYAPLAFLALQGLDPDDDELRGALRRALLLLAAGGDPHRELEPGDRAVTALAGDLHGSPAEAALVLALDALRADADDLPGVAAALDDLRRDPGLARRWAALALVAAEVTPEA